MTELIEEYFGRNKAKRHENKQLLEIVFTKLLIMSDHFNLNELNKYLVEIKDLIVVIQKSFRNIMIKYL